jgi:hypothetical protein
MWNKNAAGTRTNDQGPQPAGEELCLAPIGRVPLRKQIGIAAQASPADLSWSGAAVRCMSPQLLPMIGYRNQLCRERCRQRSMEYSRRLEFWPVGVGCLGYRGRHRVWSGERPQSHKDYSEVGNLDDSDAGFM